MNLNWKDIAVISGATSVTTLVLSSAYRWAVDSIGNAIAKRRELAQKTEKPAA